MLTLGMSGVRILGGKAKGRRLQVPRSARPSPVRLRKALFDFLRSRHPNPGSFLDLYAGSGAVGLEAASEGWDATLVEKDPEAIRLLKTNVQATGLPAKVIPKPVERFLKEASAKGEQWDVVFLAPPYPIDLMEALENVLGAQVVRPGGLVILQHPADLHLPFGERRVYGKNAFTAMEVKP